MARITNNTVSPSIDDLGSVAARVAAERAAAKEYDADVRKRAAETKAEAQRLSAEIERLPHKNHKAARELSHTMRAIRDRVHTAGGHALGCVERGEDTLTAFVEYQLVYATAEGEHEATEATWRNATGHSGLGFNPAVHAALRGGFNDFLAESLRRRQATLKAEAAAATEEALAPALRPPAAKPGTKAKAESTS